MSAGTAGGGAGAKLEPLFTFSQLALEWGMPVRSLHRLLLDLHAKDVEADRTKPRRCPRADWLLPASARGGRHRVNRSRLFVQHPALSSAKHVSREEHALLVEDVEELRGRMGKVSKQLNAHGSAIRELFERR